MIIKYHDKMNKKAEAYSESCETSKTKRFGKIVNSLKLLTIFTKRSILDIWQASEYASEKIC